MLGIHPKGVEIFSSQEAADGTERPTNVMRFGEQMLGIIGDPELTGWLEENGYTVSRNPEDLHVQTEEIRVEPPLSEQHVHDLGAKLVDLESYEKDSGIDPFYFYDERQFKWSGGELVENPHRGWAIRSWPTKQLADYLASVNAEQAAGEN